MGSILMRRVYPFACVAVMLLALLGCGGSAAPPAALDGSAGSADFEALAAPEGVAPDLWAELTAELARVLAESPPRGASTPPAGEAGAAQLSYFEPTSTLTWLYQNSGDYNQDGRVGVSDLTPLGQHFGEESPNGAGEAFPAESLGAAIDGNGDGLIGISDITPIGKNFGVLVEGYRVYTSTDVNDYPAAVDLPNGSGADLVADIALAEADATAGRLQFHLQVVPAETEQYYWVRPYHGEDDGAASNAVQRGEFNMPPIAIISAEPTKGLETLTVAFSGLASGDLDGWITKYEWDWNGPVGGEEWVDTGSQGVTEHTYDAVGDYLATLRVTDSGGMTATDEVLIKVKTPVAPVASLSGFPLTGATPLAVDFDAGASGDADGQIVSWEWDFDQSGGFAYDSGLESATSFYYYEPGTYSTTVRVTDDDGLTSTASVEVTVEPGAEWHDYTLQNTGEVRSFTALAEVQGVPAVAYDSRTTPPNQYWATYVRAEDAQGTAWAEPVTIEEVYSVSGILLAEIDGRPATACNSWYFRAEDSQGSAWPAPSMFSLSGTGGVSCALVEGLPALSRDIHYQRAADLAGESWGEVVEFAHGQFDSNKAQPSLSMVSGRPAISYRLGAGEEDSSASLMYVRSADEEGGQWGVSVAVDDSGNAGYWSQLVVVDGHPAIAYYDGTLGALRYVRALDAEGSAWGASRRLALDGRPRGMILVDDRPAIVFRRAGGLECIVANDPAGASWGLPALIATEVKDDSASVALIDGFPAVTYLNEGLSRRLHYVAYY